MVTLDDFLRPDKKLHATESVCVWQFVCLQCLPIQRDIQDSLIYVEM